MFKFNGECRSVFVRSGRNDNRRWVLSESRKTDQKKRKEQEKLHASYPRQLSASGQEMEKPLGNFSERLFECWKSEITGESEQLWLNTDN